MNGTYQASGCVVVQVDSSPRVLAGLLRVHVLFGDLLSELHVIAAATPLPASTTCARTIKMMISPQKTPNLGRFSSCTTFLFCFNIFRSPSFPFLERSQPQSSRSPRLQFLVRVYITPAALIAWTKEVSLVAVKSDLTVIK